MATRTNPHFIQVCAAVLSACVVAAACSSSGGNSASGGNAAGGPSTGAGGPSSSTSKPTIDMTYLTDYVAEGIYAPIEYAISKGYYKDEGINLKLEFGSGSATTVQEVAAGKVDVGDVFSPTMVQAVAKGADVKGVGTLFANPGFAFFCDKKLGINSYADLKGHSVIIPPGTAQATLYVAALKAGGVNPDIIHVDSVASSTAGAVYASGKSDCLIETVGDAATFQSRRPSSVLLWSNNGFNIPGYVFAVRPSYIDSHAAAIAGFLKATYKGISAAVQDPAAAAAAFVSANKTVSSSLALAQWKSGIPTLCSSSKGGSGAPQVIGAQSVAGWNRVLAALKSYAGLKFNGSASSLFTNDFFTKYHVSGAKCTPSMSS